ncbi:helix-turn-helix domain-containing protein [Pseudomonas viridiflava]|uniref:helix-turn-helix domain-containing protein n=1 Tax=Pseudomonas viridiflava TaxID=33069 RepID=UPI000F016948|nr:helix-turn-helix transcriptional regulator [Pseudomonas viridiflava]
MTKAIYQREPVIFLQVLKPMRVESGMTQGQCCATLGRPQSFMSDVERGVRRLDTAQLRDLCLVLKTNLISFSNDSELALTEEDDYGTAS